MKAQRQHQKASMPPDLLLTACVLVSMIAVGLAAGCQALVMHRDREVCRPEQTAEGGTGLGCRGHHTCSSAACSKTAWPPASQPYVIAHRGASGLLPEHTKEAYLAAIEMGADFIECDVVLTLDLQPICRHEPNLNDTTDAWMKFTTRVNSYLIDGVNITGIFACDLTLAEVRTLKALQPWPFRDQSYNRIYSIPTFQEYLDVALGADRVIGIYPETKHPTWHNTLTQVKTAKTSIEDILLAALSAWDYGHGPLNSPQWRQRPVFVQSFELGSLSYMAQRTCAPMLLLMGGWPGYTAPDTGLTHAEMTRPEALDQLRGIVSGVGPWKYTLVSWDENSQRYVSTGLLQQFHDRGLQVHPYTLRNEAQFVLPHLDENIVKEYELFFMGLGQDTSRSEGVDAGFTDFTATLHDWLLQASVAGVEWDLDVINQPGECITGNRQAQQ